MITIDTSELGTLADDFLKAALKIDPELEVILDRAGRDIQDAARENASGYPSLPHYPASITFDITHGVGTVGVEVGPDKNLPQGSLGNIIEYGSVNNPPQHNLARAASPVEPRVQAEVAVAASRIL